MYHQFADKAELFAAVFETVEAEVMAGLDAAVSAGAGDDPMAELMQLGAGAWLDACAEPEVHRIVLLDAPAVLGWERWREIGLRYGLGLVEQLLEQAMQMRAIAAQPVAPLAHVLLGALDEAALYVARADDPDRRAPRSSAVLDQLLGRLSAARTDARPARYSSSR